MQVSITTSSKELSPEEAALMAHVSAAHQRLQSWPAVAAILDGNPAEARRIALGEFPKDNKRRAELGLPVLGAARLCVKCGQLHDFVKRCGPKRTKNVKRLSDMTIKRLRWSLENREVIS